jgi:hypothetical protein
VGQQRPAVDVAGGVQPVGPLDLERVVDGEVAARREPDRLETELVGRRSAAVLSEAGVL